MEHPPASFGSERLIPTLYHVKDRPVIPILKPNKASLRRVFETIPGSIPPCRSLYIHVPFCFHKCHYCDFYSIVDTRDRQEKFTDRLIAELAAFSPRARGAPLRTIFVGGGTPSLLRVPLWKRVLRALGEQFDMSEIMSGEGEFTVECNPETVTDELMATLREGGVNRVSMGAQSFDRSHLKTLERWHDPESVPRALQIARSAGIARQSIDLIYAIPGQTLAQWDADLTSALAQHTTHLSCYALTYEPNTAMTARLKRGEFRSADEDLEADMFELTLAKLRASGLDRYEVSNFARHGDECRHNLAYWRQHDWLAAGPSAAAHIAGHRWKNSPRLDDYLDNDDAGFAPIIDHEPPDPARALAEQMMTGIRLREGVSMSVVRTLAALAAPASTDELVDRIVRVADVARDRKSMNADRNVLSLNDSGFLIADSIALEFIEAIDSPTRSAR